MIFGMATKETRGGKRKGAGRKPDPRSRTAARIAFRLSAGEFASASAVADLAAVSVHELARESLLGQVRSATPKRSQS